MVDFRPGKLVYVVLFSPVPFPSHELPKQLVLETAFLLRGTVVLPSGRLLLQYIYTQVFERSPEVKCYAQDL